MDIKELKTLIKLVTDTDISEFEMENADEKIVIKRGSRQELVQVSAPQVYAPQAVAPGQPVAAPPAAAPVAAAETLAAPEMKANQEIIKSPIVGTFYRSPSPDSDPYVEVGTTVAAGQSLCIVEAMKLMNEIEAEFKCKVVEILKENAQPVEYGDPLFVVERL